MKMRVLFIILLISWHSFSMAAVSIKIEPSTANLGEIIRLTLTIDGQNATSAPNLSNLEKDFTIIGTEHNISYTAANGVAKSESQWVILLTAKKTGILSIPALSLGSQSSPPSHITINTKPQNIPKEDNGVILQTEVNKSQPFVNEQIIYTVKLYSRTPFMNAEYLPPKVEDAILVPLGDGRHYRATLKSVDYSVDEQQYAVFAQKSGDLKITPPEFNAVIFNGVPKHITVNGQTTKLFVKPIPAKYANHPWLPTKQLLLSETYDSTSSTVNTGDTIARTINLQATAVPSELLPNISFEDNKQYSIYPDKPEIKNTLKKQELIGTSTMKVTYLMNKAGKITLPAISQTWFNTQTGLEETATLPARNILVKASLIEQPPTQQPQEPQTVISNNDDSPLNNKFAWAIAIAFAIAWLATLIIHLLSKQKKQSGLERLEHACNINDPSLAYVELLKWGNMQWPNHNLLNLNQLAQIVEDEKLTEQINILSKALYNHKNQENWSGNALWQAIKNYRPRKGNRKFGDKKLPPINLL